MSETLTRHALFFTVKELGITKVLILKENNQSRRVFGSEAAIRLLEERLAANLSMLVRLTTDLEAMLQENAALENRLRERETALLTYAYRLEAKLTALGVSYAAEMQA